jgi:anti-sigma factor RsiW
VSDCREIAAMLSEYLDRELSPETCTSIDMHLRSCPNCDRAAASLRRTVALCREFRAEDRPGPLPAEKQSELRAVFERVLDSMRRGGST